jgi:hypothetical protein
MAEYVASEADASDTDEEVSEREEVDTEDEEDRAFRARDEPADENEEALHHRLDQMNEQASSQITPPRPSLSFAIKDYALGKCLDKKALGATHFDLLHKVYYRIPEDRHERLIDLILEGYAKKEYKYLHEIPAKGKCRFFLDIDSKDDPNFDISQFMNVFQAALFQTIIAEGCTLGVEPSRPMKDLYAIYHIRPTKWDVGMVIVLKSKTATGEGYHATWPLIALTPAKKRRIMLELVRKFPDSHLDSPKTLRGPYNDSISKDEPHIGQCRPYIFHGVYDANGVKMRPFSDLEPRFPLPSEDYVENSVFLKAVYCLASLRWTAWANYALLEPAVDELEDTNNASQWRISGAIFDPRELQAAISDKIIAAEIIETVVKYVNRTVAFLFASSPPVYLVKTRDAIYHSDLPTVKPVSTAGLKALMEAPSIKLGSKSSSAFPIWSRSPLRMTITSLVFAPGLPVGSDTLNLWHGWRWGPEEISRFPWREYRSPNGWRVSDIIQFIGLNLTGAEAGCDVYVIGWIASLLQKPSIPTRTMPIFAGSEGNCKTLFWEGVSEIFAPYSAQMTGDDAFQRFNYDLMDKLFIQIDEFNGLSDKSLKSKLYSMITDPTKHFEEKGQPRITQRQQPMNFVATTNMTRELIIDVNPNQRRFPMFISSPPAGDPHAFGAQMAAFWDKAPGGTFGGCKAFQGFLAEYNLNGYDPSIFPKTKLVQQQMVCSMHPVHRFALELAFNGWCGTTDEFIEFQTNSLGRPVVYALSQIRPTHFLCEELLACFRDWAKRQHYPNPRIGTPEFVRYLDDLPGFSEFRRENDQQHLIISSIPVCLAAFGLKYVGLDINQLIRRSSMC